jgi:lipid-A-disaccharide synthase
MQQAHLGLVAGEPSSDWIGALIYEGVKQHLAGQFNFTAEGIAGERLSKAGVQALYPSDALAVRGYVEVLKHYRRILGIRNELRDRWMQQPPSLMMGVDAPDFNLGLELQLRQHGVKTVHAVCPSIWAWRAERIELLKKACDHILCIFPFEPEILRRAGISASYIGHPFAQLAPIEIDTEAFRRGLNLVVKDRLVAVLPGSRMSEVQFLGDTFIQTVMRLSQRHPDWQFISPLVSGKVGEAFKNKVPKALLEKWTLVQGRSHEIMGASDLVLLASGTATLEAMLFKKPMVIAYKMPRLSWWISKRKAYLPYAGLPNILAGKFLVPEYLQDDATPEALASAVERIIDNEVEGRILKMRFTDMHLQLKRDSGLLAAQAIEPLLGKAS